MKHFKRLSLCAVLCLSMLSSQAAIMPAQAKKTNKTAKTAQKASKKSNTKNKSKNNKSSSSDDDDGYGSDITNSNGTVSIQTTGYTESISIGDADTNTKSNSSDSNQDTEDNGSNSEKSNSDDGVWDSYGKMPASMFPFGNSANQSGDKSGDLSNFEFPTSDLSSAKIPDSASTAMNDAASTLKSIYDRIAKNQQFTSDLSKGYTGTGGMTDDEAKQLQDDYKKTLNAIGNTKNGGGNTKIPVGAKHLKKQKKHDPNMKEIIKNLNGPEKSGGGSKSSSGYQYEGFVMQDVVNNPMPEMHQNSSFVVSSKALSSTDGNKAIDKDEYKDSALYKKYLSKWKNPMYVKEDKYFPGSKTYKFTRIYAVKVKHNGKTETHQIKKWLIYLLKHGAIYFDKQGRVVPTKKGLGHEAYHESGGRNSSSKSDSSKSGSKTKKGKEDNDSLLNSYIDSGGVSQLCNELNKLDDKARGNNDSSDGNGADYSGKTVRTDLPGGGYKEPVTLPDAMNNNYNVVNSALENGGGYDYSSISGDDSDSGSTKSKGGSSNSGGNSSKKTSTTNAFSNVRTLKAITDVHISSLTNNKTEVRKFISDDGKPSYRYTVWERTSDGKKGKQITSAKNTQNGVWKDGYLYSNQNISTIDGLPEDGAFVKTEQEYEICKGVSGYAQYTDYLIDTKTKTILWMRSNGFQNISDLKSTGKTKWIQLGDIKESNNSNSNFGGNSGIERIE